jgi:two-component system, cell cycle sensor histidine kinase and response regulator CckA
MPMDSTPPDVHLPLSILDGSPDPIFVLDTGWVMRYANPACAGFLERGEPTGMIGHPIFEVVPELHGTVFREQIERAMAGARVTFELDHAVCRKWADVTASPCDDGVAVFVRDVSAHRRREAEFTASHARLAAIVNSAPDLVVAVDHTLTLLAFNKAYAAEFSRVFNRPIRVGDDFRTLLADHPVALAEVVERWERAAVAGEEYTVQRTLGADGGPTRVYEVRYSSLRDETGTLLGAVSSMTDVTERARDRSALAELTERLDAVIRYSPDRVVGVDRELRIVALNEHARHDFSHLWGVSIEVGDSLTEKLVTLPDEQRAATLAMWDAAVNGRAANQFAVFGRTPETMQAYEISFGALRDRSGQPAGAVMVAKDVTDREVALTALRESEARFRALGEAAPIGIFLADVCGHCTYANPRLQQIVEQHEATLMTHGFASRIHPDDVSVTRAWLGVSGDANDFRGEFRLVMEDGAERFVLAHSAAIRDQSGAIVGRVGTLDDITEARQAADSRRALEQKMLRAQKLESLEVLAGGIAHDFNNLLVGVLGNASLALLDLEPDAPAYAPVTDIQRAAHRASDLTRQMLAYSGRGQFIVEPVDLSELVAEMGSLLRTVLSRDAVISFDLVPTLPLIDADATQVRQVVMNLITNASDAVGERGGTIAVRTGRQSVVTGVLEHSYLGEPIAPGEYVFVEVEDTGEGMSEETISRIFEPFFSTKFTGRGLGLAATLGIVRGHRGGLSIKTSLGVGSQFRVLLPVAPIAPSSTLDTAGHADDPRRGAVLIIDDDETVRVVARRLLERRGFSVVVASDGAEGLTIFRAAPAGHFALVLLDLTMPQMDGAATMAALCVEDPAVRVLLTSGYREREVTARFIGLEPAGFVQKPFRAEELYTAVAKALR